MSDLRDLKKRAIDLRKLFAERESRTTGRVWTRADPVRGFVGDVGALAKLSMAADGVRTIANHEVKLGHEFADCLWSLLILADEYGIDLEAEFQRLVDQLSAELSA